MGAAAILTKGFTQGVPDSPLGGYLGVNGGAGGTGFKNPTLANVQPGVSADQLASSASGTQNSLASQQALLAALQNQNGLGQQNTVAKQQQALNQQLAANQGASNLGSVYNQQGNFNQQLGGANGIGTQNAAIAGLQGVAGQQANTAQQYQGIANGTGPNPAQAMLNQATGENVANQAALMAGQRGAASNVGLLARQAAQQGAATQQQAVGQGATLQAQQQLNALSGLSAQQQAQAATQQAIGGLGTTQVGAQQTGITNQAQLATQQVASQQAAQNALAQQANSVAGQQIAGTTANNQAQQSEQQIQQNALAAQNQQQVAAQGNVNTANAGLASTTLQGQQGLVGGVLNGVGSALGLAGGGEVDKPEQYAFKDLITITPAPSMNEPQSAVGKFLKGYAANGGIATKYDYRSGGDVKAKSPREKAIKGGDSYSNDKIPALLSEKEIVLPRSVTQSKDPARSAAEFVAKVLAKKGKRYA